MDQQQLAQLDRDLAVEEETLIKQLKEFGVENPAVPGDFEPVMPNYEGNTEDDRINEATDLDRNVAMEQQLEKRLKEIRTVREQIASGAYGVCVGCASPIASDRLEAMPTAVLCMDCAQKL